MTKLLVVLLFICLGLSAYQYLQPISEADIRAGAPEDTYGGSFVLTWFIGVPASTLGLVLALARVRRAASRKDRWLGVLVAICFAVAGVSMLLTQWGVADRVLR